MKCLNSIKIIPSTLTLELGKWYDYAEIEYCPEDAECKCVAWSSDDTSIASVNPVYGYIYGNGVGTTTVRATACDGSGVSASMTVTVLETVPVSCITLNTTTIVMEHNERYTLKATVCPSNATNPAVNWYTSNSGVVRVCDGELIPVEKGTATVAAVAADGSGVQACCEVTVNHTIPISSISFNEPSKEMYVGDSCFFAVTVLPEDATTTYGYSSSDKSIATVDSKYGIVTAIGEGEAYIIATSHDNGHAEAYCQLKVKNRPVSKITLCTNKLNMTVGDIIKLKAEIEPSNATNKWISWSSSNTCVATVYNGYVSAVGAGTATVTVKTDDGGHTAKCTVTVEQGDTRESVTITKDDEGGYKFFKVTFKNGLIWKSVGVERTFLKASNLMYATHFKRANANAAREYSDKQLAFLYRLDPLGVEYYVNTYTSGKGWSIKDILEYRDRIYLEIFGTYEKDIEHFYFQIDDNNNVTYGGLSGDRTKVYSNAEVLFGEHIIWDWDSIKSDIAKIVFEKIPGVSEIQLGIDIFKGLFFSSSLVGTVNGAASDFLDKYCEDYSETTDDSLHEIFFGWVRTVFEVLKTVTDMVVDTFTPKNINDITLYSNIDNKSNYRIEFASSDINISMSDIIDRCN